MKRLIAHLLAAVFALTTVAPAAFAVQPPAAHCMRKPLAAPAEAMPMHCHEGGQMHAMPEPPTDPHKLQSRNCCLNHDCCRSVTRSQWAHFAPEFALVVSAAAHSQAMCPAPQRAALLFRAVPSGRAPPASL
jgi:hypothetical protein